MLIGAILLLLLAFALVAAELFVPSHGVLTVFAAGAAIAAVWLAVAIAEMGALNPPEMTPQFFLGTWFILGLATDVVFAAMARRKLRT